MYWYVLHKCVLCFILYQGLYCNEYKLFLPGWYSYEDLEEPPCVHYVRVGIPEIL